MYSLISYNDQVLMWIAIFTIVAIAVTLEKNINGQEQ